MKKTESKSKTTSLLRQKAEELRKKRPPTALLYLSESETLKLIQELEVHQIELEMQNEELVLAKEKAELTAEKHSALYDFAPTGYFTLTKDGTILELNLCSAKMLGKERGHLVNKALGLFITDTTKQIYNNLLEKTFKSQTKECGEVTLIADGIPTASVYLTSIASENGEQCFMTMVDISERKQTEEYREMSRTILQILNEPVDLYTSIQQILSTLKTQTGFDAVGIRLQHGDDFPYFAQDGFPGNFLQTENTLAERSTNGDVCRDKDGSVCLECTCGLVISGKTDPSMKIFTKGGSAWTKNSFPILNLPLADDPRHNPRNQCIHEGYATIALIPIKTNEKIIGLIQFNDKRKDLLTLELVELLEIMASHLGSAFMRKQADEKQQKYEERLQQTQKLESLGLLAGGIAHDFNNLMGGIFGYIELANEESFDVNVTGYLSKAMDTINRARALTGRLLTFSKGGEPIQNIDHLFPFVNNIAQFALSGANVSCHYDVPNDLWACNFDKNQIGQVIDNLITNAQQAMPGGGTIVICAQNITLTKNEHPILSNGNYVRLRVKDTGIGIPNELFSKIFDPFFTTKTKGHGLGLATCYSIINQHGGCIDVESEVGNGSTFQVYLPASIDDALFSTDNASSSIDKDSSSIDKDSSSTGKASASTDTSVATHTKCGTFLIMDDEDVIRETISAMLKSLGYTTVCKNNGNDAVEFFSSEIKAKRKIAGMIFDLTVPGGMGGKAAVNEIRKLDKEINVFVASGYAEDPVMKNPIEYGFTASICKPFRKFELLELLNRYMNVNK